MENHQNQNKPPSPPPPNIVKNWEKLLAFTFGVVILLLIIALVFIEEDLSNHQVYFFRTALALAGAGVAAVIPGFLKVSYKPILRAGGAIAVFVIIYLINPPQLTSYKPHPEVEGFLGDTQKAFLARHDTPFSLILEKDELNDFYIDGTIAGDTWGEVFQKLCRAYRCLTCEPNAEDIGDEVKISLSGGLVVDPSSAAYERKRLVCS